MDIWQIILSPFVALLTLFYNIFGSYGLALIFFAIVIKLILFPFSLKGKKGMIQMNMLSGKMQQLQKAYGNNRERYNQEVQALYAKEKINPMSGCLWSFLPLIILFPLYAIIRQPLKYMMGLDASAMSTIADAVNWGAEALSNGWIKTALPILGITSSIWLRSFARRIWMWSKQPSARRAVSCLPSTLIFLALTWLIFPN